MTSLSSSRGTLFVLAAALLWGTTGTAAAFAPTLSPLIVGAAAMGLGGLLQAGIAAPGIVAFRRSLANQWRTVAVSAVAAAAYPLAFYSSMRMAGVAVGTVVSIGSAPLFATLVDVLTREAILTWRRCVGLALGIAGVGALALASAHGSGSISAETPTLGIALGLAAGATYAVYTWGAGRVMASGCPSRVAMGTVFGVAAALLSPVIVLGVNSIGASPDNVVVVAYLAVVPMFLGYWLFGKGLSSVSASTATTLTLAEPAAAALIAILVLDERLSALGWVGMAVLLVSLTFTVGADDGSHAVPMSRPARCRPWRRYAFFDTLPRFSNDRTTSPIRWRTSSSPAPIGDP